MSESYERAPPGLTITAASSGDDSSPDEPVLDGTGDARPRIDETPMVPPTRIGRFVPLTELGRGAMGIVLAAYDPELDRRIAIKLMTVTSRGSTGDRAAERMLREARALAKLTHRNVVAVHDVGTVDGTPYIAMELVEGLGLDRWLTRDPSWRDVLEVFEQAGRGLAAAHAAGLVHRDFKPSNVVIASDGRVVVLDFGLARAPVPGLLEVAAATGLDPSATEGGAMLGTPAYMSPEQWRGLPVDARSDQFNFCVALWEALCRQHPFDRSSTLALAQTVTTGKLREPGRVRAPRRVLEIVGRGLALDPAQRWPTMDDLLDAIGRSSKSRWPTIALGVGALATAGFAATRSESPAPDACAEVGARVSAVWTDERREAIEKQFDAVGLAFAQDAWERVAPALDAYARAWSAASTDACRTSSGLSAAAAQTRALVNACLGDALFRFDALIERLGRGGSQPDRAIDAVAALPALDRCADGERLRRASPDGPPDEPEARAALVALTVALDVGDHEAIDATAGALRSFEVRDPTLRADVARALAEVADLEGRVDEARDRLEGAAIAALAAGRDEAFLGVASDLVAYLIVTGRSVEAASTWFAVASATKTRGDITGPLELELLASGTRLAQTEQRLALALERATEAVEVSTARMGRDSVYALRARADKAHIQSLRREYHEALAEYDDIIAASAATYGRFHPTTLQIVAFSLQTRVEAGIVEDTVARARQSLADHESTFGGDSPATTWARLNFASALAQTGEWSEADASLARTHELLVATFGVDYRTSGVTCERARLALLMGEGERAWTFATQCLDEARAGAEQDEHGDVAHAGVLVDVLDIAVRTGRLAEAEAYIRELDEVFTREDSGDETEAIAGLLAAEVARRSGDDTARRTRIDAAIAWLETHDRTHTTTWIDALLARAELERRAAPASAAAAAAKIVAAVRAQAWPHPIALRRALLAHAAAAIDAGDRGLATQLLDEASAAAKDSPVDPECDVRLSIERLRLDRPADLRAQLGALRSRARMHPRAAAALESAEADAERR